MITNVFLDQKKVDLCEHKVKTAPSLLCVCVLFIKRSLYFFSKSLSLPIVVYMCVFMYLRLSQIISKLLLLQVLTRLFIRWVLS
jgi:hypothetical protein